MLLSTCCDAPVNNEFDHICSKCKEHCDIYDDEIAPIVNDIIRGSNEIQSK